MSIKIMSEIWESDLPPTDRFVMLSLADHADEHGQCYPSIARLSKRTGFGERTVQNAVKRLVSGGYLVVSANAGRGGANLYSINSTPAGNAPPQEMRPRTRCTRIPPQEMHPAGDAPPQLIPNTPAGDAPKPSGNRHTTAAADAGAQAREINPPQGAENGTFRERLLVACGADPVSGLTGHGGSQIGRSHEMVEAERWITDLGLTEAEVVEEVTRLSLRNPDKKPGSLKYFTKAMEELAGRLAEARSKPMSPKHLTTIPGGRNERRNRAERADEARRETIRRVAAGEIDLGDGKIDPFG